ncbi:ATP-binding protein [Streptomyces sp. E11-3]|uniref:ATP-binding protein n=1 Tax=Streptomyces sp. E11-3 TaxID=3110112 RepID=UPI00397EAF07
MATNGTITNGHDQRVKLVSLHKPEAAPTPAADTAAKEQPQEAKTERRRLRRIRTVLADDRTREAYRLAVRHGSYLTGGARIVARRAWEDRTTARYARMMRTAEAAGNAEETREWEERAHRFRQARHQRRMELLAAIRQAPKAAGAGVLTGTGVLLLLGAALAWANGDVKDVIAPTVFVVDLVQWAFVIGSVVWGPAKMVIPAFGLLALWRVGQQRQAAPAWALPAKLRADGDPITPSIVVKAFRDLGISDLRKAITAMEDAGASMLTPITIAGCGVELEVHLPSGVDTSEIEKRRKKLAENMGRHEHELFILKSQQARTVGLWIADSGALDEPIGPSPLVTDPDIRADYKNGRAPWGNSLRGDPAGLSVYQRHLLITGLSNQGKTAALRAIALWLAHDRRVEFWIGDLKGIGDWRMFVGIATKLIEGPTDDHVIDVTEDLMEAGVAEMERRLLAPTGTKWDPLIIIVDEAQLAFMCPVRTEEWTESGKLKEGAPYGGTKSTSRYFMAARKIHNQGRAVDVLLWQGTQDPTDQNLPKLVREGAHIRASLVVGSESQGRMALGDKAVDGGAAPHLLRQGLDKGTLVVAGDGADLPPGEASMTIRTHFIDTDPDAHDVAERVKALRRGVVTDTGAQDEELDHLADIEAILPSHTRRMRTQEVLQRLAERHETYREWTFETLTDYLETFDAAPHKSDGRMVVDREKIRRALLERDSKGQGGAES